MARHQAAHSHPRRADTRYRRRGQSRGPRADEPTGTRRRVDPDALQRAARDPGHVRSHPGHASGPPDRRVHPRAGLAGGDHGLRRMTAVAAPIREPGTRPAVTRGLGNRFLQRYGTLLILLALCLVFTVVGPWRTSREACNLWQQVTSLSLVKNGQLCAPVFASQVNILNLVRQVSVIGIVALGGTGCGRGICAIGGDESAARLSGTRVDLFKTLVFVISGLGAAVGALILTTRLTSGQPNSGQGYELDAIASVVIGGTTLSGGRGTGLGTLAGALLVGALLYGVVAIKGSAVFQAPIQGGAPGAACPLRQI